MLQSYGNSRVIMEQRERVDQRTRDTNVSGEKRRKRFLAQLYGQGES